MKSQKGFLGVIYLNAVTEGKNSKMLENLFNITQLISDKMRCFFFKVPSLLMPCWPADLSLLIKAATYQIITMSQGQH